MKNRAAEAAFKKKQKRRAELARLPFEKKIEIVVELQKAAVGIRKTSAHRIWPIGGPSQGRD